MDDESIRLLGEYQRGDERAADLLYQRYVHRLIGLARSRLSNKLARRVDPEDVVQSAYRSFFVHARDESAFELKQSGDLWRLLAGITVNKVLHQVQRHQRKKRSIDQEQSTSRMDDCIGLVAERIQREPDPADALALVEELQTVMETLDPMQRQILELRLQERRTDEIAETIQRSERTVRRVLEKVKSLLEKRFAADQS